MSQWKAFLALKRLAKAQGVTMGRYCDERKVSRAVPHYWKKTRGVDVKQETLDRLGIKFDEIRE